MAEGDIMLAEFSRLQVLHLIMRLAVPREEGMGFVSYLLKLTKFGWISRQEVHCTLKL